MFQDIRKDKLFWVRLFAFSSFLIPMVLSPRIWFSERFFPLISVFDFLPIPSFTIDIILITFFLLSFLSFVFNPTWKLGMTVIAIYTYWILLDQNRIQPFYFEMIFMVLALTQFGSNFNLVKQC